MEVYFATSSSGSQLITKIHWSGRITPSIVGWQEWLEPLPIDRNYRMQMMDDSFAAPLPNEACASGGGASGANVVVVVVLRCKQRIICRRDFLWLALNLLLFVTFMPDAERFTWLCDRPVALKKKADVLYLAEFEATLGTVQARQAAPCPAAACRSLSRASPLHARRAPRRLPARADPTPR